MGRQMSRKQPNSLPMHIKYDMKQQAKITGPKVHDVGYRIFLMEAALDCGVMRISACWWEEDSSQVVVCLDEGDEARIAAFKKFIESHKPVKAEVSDITWEDYDGDVIAAGTPPGVGPLKKGDAVEVEIEGIGTLRNFEIRRLMNT